MKSALSEALGDSDGAPTGKHYKLYERWSKGGYGLVVTGNIMIDGRQLGEPGNVVVEDERHLAELSHWAKTFQDGTDAPLWAQINHPGRQATAMLNSQRPVAPSAVKANVPVISTKPRELRPEEIEEILDRYATAAAVLEAAGFNGVQLHAAHGYLITQFLSPLSNQRSDQWGGDPERRRRFLLEAVRRVRARVSPSFGVGVKLNSADFQRGGFTEDESRDVIRALADEAVDLIEISGGSYESPAMLGMPKTAASTAAREAYFLEYAKTARGQAGSIPLAVTGGFRSRSAMGEAVASGACDVVGLGRPTVTTPNAGEAVLKDRVDRLGSPGVRAGLRPIIGKVADLKQLDSMLDLQWHTQQMERIGDGKDPDLGRTWWQTALAMTLKMGPAAFRRRRRGF
jgi:2,4-dienoyl-CoA reductase-like NADH-dependent reductase (Old Yellow Enzyme family)